MSRTRRPPRTLLEICVTRGGSLKGGRVGAFIAQWAMASRSMGHSITLDEYADWWCESRSASFRHQRLFRELFPHLDTPQPLADALIRAYDDELFRRGVKGLLLEASPDVHALA